MQYFENSEIFVFLLQQISIFFSEKIDKNGIILQKNTYH